MSTLQTLDRGLRALDVISRSTSGISIAELAAELGVHRAICYRIVATLESHTLVARSEDGRVHLAAGTAVLASRFEPRFNRDARPLLQQLADETGATSFLAVAEGQECVVLLAVEPRDVVFTVGYRVGSRHPITRGAAGIAILAARPEHPDDSEEVRQARQRGYSLTRGQLEPGAVGVAAGLHTSNGAGASLVERSIGAVALDNLDTSTAIPAVLRTARELERLLDC